MTLKDLQGHSYNMGQ